MVPAITRNEVKLSNGLRLPLLGLGTTHSGGYSHDAVVYALKHCGKIMIYYASHSYIPLVGKFRIFSFYDTILEFWTAEDPTCTQCGCALPLDL
uniref:Uncharacterized protein n=1 Tax=Romanomermis culicivorax TaxID=13658 RepID=A0A915KF36_ROMCU